MMPAQKTEQYRDELRSSRTEMVQHEDMNMTMHSTITIREDGPYVRLTQAWQWLETQRSASPDSADIWHLRHRHATDGAYLTDLLHALQSGRYRLSPMQLCGEGENKRAMWGAQDALVLKWVALCIQPLLPLHLSCEHVKGHGGGKQSVGKLHDLLTRTYTGETQHNDRSKKTGGYPWVCRTDIRGDYRHINKDTLFAQVRQHVSDPVLRDLVHQYLHYTVEDGGTFHTPETGISRGCALSPLMGALHLYDMDAHFSAQKNIHYARYMDDVIILAKSRWSLRRHTKRLMQWFAEYGFEAHPDKTQIGRTEKGFDWLGAWLTHEGVTDIAPRAKANHREKVRRLYEQLARVPKWLRHRRQQQVHARVSTYRKRWHIWAGALVSGAILWGPACASAADRVVYVLASNLVPGTVLPGGAFVSTGTWSGTAGTGKYENRVALIQLMTSNGSPASCPSTYCVNGGIQTGLQVPGTTLYGFRIVANDVWMVPTTGLVHFALSNFKGTLTVDPSKPNMCGELTPDPGSYDMTCSNGSYNPLLVSQTSNWQNIPVLASNADWNLTFSLIAGANVSPGATNIPDQFGVAIRGNPSVNSHMDHPTAIVIAGLTCNLSAGSNGVASARASSNEQAQVVAGSAMIPVTVTCTGTNDSGSEVPVGLQIVPSGSTTSPSVYRLSDPGQPSFYSTLTVGAADCTDSGTNVNKMKIGGGYSNRVRSYAVNESGKSDSVSLVWALCSTGNTTQPPGQYAITATASIVSF